MWLNFRVIKNVKGRPGATEHVTACAKFSQQVPLMSRRPTVFQSPPYLANAAEPALKNIYVTAVMARKSHIQ